MGEKKKPVSLSPFLRMMVVLSWSEKVVPISAMVVSLALAKLGETDVKRFSRALHVSPRRRKDWLTLAQRFGVAEMCGYGEAH